MQLTFQRGGSAGLQPGAWSFDILILITGSALIRQGDRCFSYLAITSVIPSARPTRRLHPDDDWGRRARKLPRRHPGKTWVPYPTARAKHTVAQPRDSWIRQRWGRAADALPGTGGAGSSLRAPGAFGWTGSFVGAAL